MKKLAKINRRQALQGMSAVAVATCLPGKLLGDGPAIHVKRRRKLRVLGTHVTLQEDLRKRAQADLGIEVSFQPGGDAAVLHQASTRPDSFDLYEQWSNSIRVLWQANAIQPLDVNRLTYWNEINGLARTGLLTPEAQRGAGDAPNKLLYVQPDGTLGSTTSEQISFLPYVHNVDSFGYNAAVVPAGIPYETESWSWLLDERWAGRVAIANCPTIGLFDLALAVQAKGLAKFADIGNLTRLELDMLFDILMEYRSKGQFRGIWSSVPASVKLMERGDSCIGSMFSPAVFDLRGKGVNCIYASPREGYRAWHGVMCLSSKTNGEAKEAAYEYMNWWLSGWPGAFIARQGYYISNPERSRSDLSDAEWDYWYMGKPAREDLLGTNGNVVVRRGEMRNGGSYDRRFSHIAVWNSVMNTYEFSLPRWNEFLSG
jgi:putative spermidine/putrescine transport system substrate-binding protein